MHDCCKDFIYNNGSTCLFQGAKSITTFEILPQPPASRAKENPWPTWPAIFRVDYGHAEVQLKFGRDPRVYNIMSKVQLHLKFRREDGDVYIFLSFCPVSFAILHRPLFHIVHDDVIVITCYWILNNYLQTFLEVTQYWYIFLLTTVFVEFIFGQMFSIQKVKNCLCAMHLIQPGTIMMVLTICFSTPVASSVTDEGLIFRSLLMMVMEMLLEWRRFWLNGLKMWVEDGKWQKYLVWVYFYQRETVCVLFVNCCSKQQWTHKGNK